MPLSTTLSDSMRRRLSRRLSGARGYARSWPRFAPFLSGLWAKIAGLGALTVAVVALRLLEPWPLKLIIDAVFLGQPPASLARFELSPMALLLWLVAALLAIVALAAGVRYVQRLLASQLGLTLSHRLRMRLFSHTLTLPPGFHERRRSGDMVMRLMGDIRILRQAFISMPARTLEEALLVIGMTALMLWIDWQLTLVAAIVAPVALIFLSRFHGPMRAVSRKQRKRQAQIASTASEALSAMRVVQAHGREEAEVRKFGKSAKKDMRSGLEGARLEGEFKWALELTVGVAMALVITVATIRVRSGAMTPGDLVIFATYLSSFYAPFRRLARTLKRFNRAAAAAERVEEILEVQPPETGPEPAPKGRSTGRVTLRDVTVERDGRRVLDGVSLDIAPGEFLFLLGETGSGKSTIAKLLPRLVDADGGQVLLDGTDVRDHPLTWLRRQIMYVPQEALLFAGSAGQNVVYPHSNDPKMDLDELASASGLDALIAELRDRWETRVAERGQQLSGGQRQALSLLRGIVSGRQVMIFDEPTTGLDPENARALMEALRDLEGMLSVLIITHDTSLIRPEDRVVRLENGRVVEPRGGET